jgi:hypothetical protein
VAETKRARRPTTQTRVRSSRRDEGLKVELFTLAIAAEGGTNGLDLLRAGRHFIRVPEFPFTVPELVLPLIVSAPSDYLEDGATVSVELSVFDGKGMEITPGEGELRVTHQRASGGKMGDPLILQSILRLSRVPLESAGRHTIVLTFNGEELATTWFRTQQPSQKPDTTGIP